MALDDLLGPDVVVATEGGLLRLDDEALGAQLHREPPKGELCWCPGCKRARASKRRKTVPQPWEPKQAKTKRAS